MIPDILFIESNPAYWIVSISVVFPTQWIPPVRWANIPKLLCLHGSSIVWFKPWMSAFLWHFLRYFSLSLAVAVFRGWLYRKTKIEMFSFSFVFLFCGLTIRGMRWNSFIKLVCVWIFFPFNFGLWREFVFSFHSLFSDRLWNETTRRGSEMKYRYPVKLNMCLIKKFIVQFPAVLCCRL